jgi:hypothetical protein
MIELQEHKQNIDDKINFTDIIVFKLTLSKMNNKKYQKKLDSICLDCSKNFKHNFIILEKVSARIAGGYLDNHEGWVKGEKGTVHRSDYAWQAKYELRCMGTDATYFMMRWS